MDRLARDANGVDDLAPWVERIRSHLTLAVEGIVAAGRDLIAAKDALPHGSWLPLLDEVGLSPDMAQRFMRVARHPVLADAAQARHLPPTVTVLAVLTRLDEDELAEAIDAGEVTPALTRMEAAALVSGVVAWALLDAELDQVRLPLVEVFRRYEGQVTAEGDTVTVETFAEHADIPVETFRQWLGGC
jgi:hypothetical protein